MGFRNQFGDLEPGFFPTKLPNSGVMLSSVNHSSLGILGAKRCGCDDAMGHPITRSCRDGLLQTHDLIGTKPTCSKGQALGAIICLNSTKLPTLVMASLPCSHANLIKVGLTQAWGDGGISQVPWCPSSRATKTNRPHSRRS